MLAENIEEPKDLRSYIDVVSRLSIHQEPLFTARSTSALDDVIDTYKDSVNVPPLELISTSESDAASETPEDQQQSKESFKKHRSKGKKHHKQKHKNKTVGDKAVDLPPLRGVSASKSQSSYNDVPSPLPSLPSSMKNDPLLAQSKIINILQCIDEDVVHSWLLRANEMSKSLRSWCQTPNRFVRFSEFLLKEWDSEQKYKLIQMEIEIVLDELQAGCREKIPSLVADLALLVSVTLNDWVQLSSVDSSKGKSHLNAFVLNTFVVVVTTKSPTYNRLLSNIAFSTSDKSIIQSLLSIRAFALFNILSAIVKFFNSARMLSSNPLYNAKLRDEKPASTCLHFEEWIELVAEDALINDCLATLVYLNRYQKLNPNKRDEEERNLLFRAIMHKSKRCVAWLVNNVTVPALNHCSITGNAPLHAAVNSGDEEIVACLLNTPGIDINVLNSVSDNVAPIHLAVIHGFEKITILLIKAGCATSLHLNEATIRDLAETFGHSKIVAFLESL